jgi:GT2 family glycosyltransferase
MTKSISVVIPNYNGKELLEQNIPHVYNALISSKISDFEIIISDDASNDDSVNFIKSNYPEIILVANKINKGFAGNINSGIFKSTKDLVLLLNSDVVLTEEYFRHQLPYFNRDDTFGVMGRITSIDSKKNQDGAKYPKHSLSKIATNVNYISDHENSLYSFFLLGANSLVDRKKLFEINGFCELYNPYNSEDVDLSLRAWRLGYKCYYEHKAVCKHPVSSTLKKEDNKKVRIVSLRNQLYLHYTHLNNYQLPFYVVAIVGKTIYRTITLDRSYLKSVYLFVLSFQKCRMQKQIFVELQKQKELNISTWDVVSFIKNNIGNKIITTF